MLRLRSRPNEYDGIDLSLCGFLFLGTPFCGSLEAQWDDILLAAAKAASGARIDLLQQLKVFNPFNVLRKEDFQFLDPQPPFFCFCEGQRTSSYGRWREVKILDTGIVRCC